MKIKTIRDGGIKKKKSNEKGEVEGVELKGEKGDLQTRKGGEKRWFLNLAQKRGD